MLSGSAVGLLAGNHVLAAKTGGDSTNDVRILNTALNAELEAIAAYQLGAESKLLEKPVLDLATTFQGHHKQHAELLAANVSKLGGKLGRQGDALGGAAPGSGRAARARGLRVVSQRRRERAGPLSPVDCLALTHPL